jgi:hypothetical protein
MKSIKLISLLAIPSAVASFNLNSYLRSLRSSQPHLYQQNLAMPPLSDIIPRISQIQIFASLIRDVDVASQRLEDESLTTIVLAPDNAALRAMDHKPWRSSSDVEQFGTEAYEGEVGTKRANNNLRKFVERQIVSLGGEWRENERLKTVGGKQVWWETNGDGKIVSLP